jgi:transcriptional regulator with XRE-family HTH domain
MGSIEVSFEYLRDLQKRHGLTVREVARRSRVLADALHQPRLAFQHQAMSGWLNGKRKPTYEHRRALALIFQVSLEELSRGLDGPLDPNSAGAVLKPVIVHVRGNKQLFRHHASLPSSLDLTRPAVYRRWTDLFQPWPAALIRHFREINHDLFGWIPDNSAGPLIAHPRSLVLVNTSAAHLEEAEAVQKRIWFIYVPGGNLDVGIAHREGRSLVLSKFDHDHSTLSKKYPLSRIDIVGHVTGKIMFHLDVL